jgi:hypothetical protein
MLINYISFNPHCCFKYTNCNSKSEVIQVGQELFSLPYHWLKQDCHFILQQPWSHTLSQSSTLCLFLISPLRHMVRTSFQTLPRSYYSIHYIGTWDHARTAAQRGALSCFHSVRWQHVRLNKNMMFAPGSINIGIYRLRLRNALNIHYVIRLQYGEFVHKRQYPRRFTPASRHNTILA